MGRLDSQVKIDGKRIELGDIEAAAARLSECRDARACVQASTLGARRIGQICFEAAKEADLTVALVTDAAIVQAQKALWQAHRQLVEPAGAAALAALLSGAYEPEAGERVAVLVCGGNIAPDPEI